MFQEINTAFDYNAPPDEQMQAYRELSKIYVPTKNDIIQINNEDIDLAKSWMTRQVLSVDEKEGKSGPQSLMVDGLQVLVKNGYWDKPSALSFDILRVMADQMPVVSSIIMSMVRHVAAYNKPFIRKGIPGFNIKHRDPSYKMKKVDEKFVQTMKSFMTNCGFEARGRYRKSMGRDNFLTFISKITRDSLIMDSTGIELESKYDAAKGLDGFYAVDGGTIRLCTEEGYQGDDRVKYVQVVNDKVVTVYTDFDLIYEPRNPRTNINVNGYGMSELELLIKVVIGFMNAMTNNISGFDRNALPPGFMTVIGEYDAREKEAFRRYWNSMVTGVANRYRLPLLFSSTPEAKAEFTPINKDFNEMHFAKWMIFLTSLSCAMYGVTTSEIEFDNFSDSRSSLSGSDTAEKLAHTKNKGIRALLSYHEMIFTDYIISEFNPNYIFTYGMDEDDEEGDKLRIDLLKASGTVDEVRKEIDLPPNTDIGSMPINKDLIGGYMNATGQGYNQDNNDKNNNFDKNNKSKPDDKKDKEDIPKD